MSGKKMSALDVQNNTVVNTVHTSKLKIQSQPIGPHIVRHPKYYQSKQGVFYNSLNDTIVQITLPNKQYIPALSHQSNKNTIEFNKGVYWNPHLQLQNELYYDKTNTKKGIQTRNSNIHGFVEWSLQ